MIIIGDSAGGNLSAALLVALRDKKLPLPKLAVLISPCTSFSSDDAVLLAQYAKNDGVDVTLSIYKGMSNDWTLIMPELPETKVMFEEIAELLNWLIQV